MHPSVTSDHDRGHIKVTVLTWWGQPAIDPKRGSANDTCQPQAGPAMDAVIPRIIGIQVPWCISPTRDLKTWCSRVIPVMAPAALPMVTRGAILLLQGEPVTGYTHPGHSPHPQSPCKACQFVPTRRDRLV